MFDLILIKFREKKTLIIEETKVSIENFWYSLIIDEVVEEIRIVGMKNNKRETEIKNHHDDQNQMNH